MENYNLKEMSAQEVFNTVAKHLLTQNKKSENPLIGSLCLYKYNNLKCAAGIFIPDDKYVSKMEGLNWAEIVNLYDFLKSDHDELIISLQRIHDFIEPTFWKRDLNFLAKHLKLEPYEFN